MVKPSLAKLLDKQIRVVLTDGRHFIGKLLSFDGHMNLVLIETQEFRKTKKGNKEQRRLGLVMVRGDMIVSTTAESTLVSHPANQKSTQPITMQL